MRAEVQQVTIFSSSFVLWGKLSSSQRVGRDIDARQCHAILLTQLRVKKFFTQKDGSGVMERAQQWHQCHHGDSEAGSEERKCKGQSKERNTNDIQIICVVLLRGEHGSLPCLCSSLLYIKGSLTVLQAGVEDDEKWKHGLAGPIGLITSVSKCAEYLETMNHC